MEVMVGSTFEIGTVKDRTGVTTHDKGVQATMSTSGGNRMGSRRYVRSQAEELSESSSSVRESSENDEEEEDDGVSSSSGRWLSSFSSSLEDSLPIKRGLSNHYIGKSKSFGNLMEASNAKDLEKVESPLNKRRRLLIANKFRRRSSLSSFSIYSKTYPKSMPLLALQESYQEDNNYNNDDDDDDDYESIDSQTSKVQEKKMRMTNNRDFMVQTQSCLCLTSFQDDDL